MTKNSIYFQKPIENRTISTNTMATTKSNLKSEQRHCYKGLSLTMMILLFDLPSPIVFWFRNTENAIGRFTIAITVNVIIVYWFHNY